MYSWYYKKARDNKIRISNEGTTYVCAKGTNDAEETDVICESYKLDKTAPTIGTLNVNGNRGLNDWFVGDVTISYTDSTDELSGMDTNILNPSATKVTTDTAGTTYTLTAKDKAGNTSQVSYVVKRDTKAPNVGKALFNGLEYNANKWFNSNVTVSVVNGSDSTSGHFTTTTDVSTVTNQGSVNKVVLTTTDKAGNTSTRGYNIKLDKKPLQLQLDIHRLPLGILLKQMYLIYSLQHIQLAVVVWNAMLKNHWC